MAQPTVEQQLANVRPRIEKLARVLVGRAGAEFDDLVQEGLIAAWESLQAGHVPTDTFLTHRMKNWVRTLRGQVPG